MGQKVTENAAARAESLFWTQSNKFKQFAVRALSYSWDVELPSATTLHTTWIHQRKQPYTWCRRMPLPEWFNSRWSIGLSIKFKCINNWLSWTGPALFLGITLNDKYLHGSHSWCQRFLSQLLQKHLWAVSKFCCFRVQTVHSPKKSVAICGGSSRLSSARAWANRWLLLVAIAGTRFG